MPKYPGSAKKVPHRHSLHVDGHNVNFMDFLQSENARVNALAENNNRHSEPHYYNQRPMNMNLRNSEQGNFMAMNQDYEMHQNHMMYAQQQQNMCNRNQMMNHHGCNGCCCNQSPTMYPPHFYGNQMNYGGYNQMDSMMNNFDMFSDLSNANFEGGNYQNDYFNQVESPHFNQRQN